LAAVSARVFLSVFMSSFLCICNSSQCLPDKARDRGKGAIPIVKNDVFRVLSRRKHTFTIIILLLPIFVYAFSRHREEYEL